MDLGKNAEKPVKRRHRAEKGNLGNSGNLEGLHGWEKRIEENSKMLALLAVIVVVFGGGLFLYSSDWFMFDLGLATQTLCLVAHSLGLGTVIVGLIDHDKVKKILNVPDGYEVVALIPVGYPAQKPSAPKRREISEFMRYDTF